MAQEDTVRVRIAVLMNGDGQWSAEGWRDASDERLRDHVRDTFLDCEWLDEHTQLRFIEADLPIPRAETFAGRLAD